MLTINTLRFKPTIRLKPVLREQIVQIIIMIVLLLAGSKALAAQDFEYIPGNKIRAVISSSNLNRIEFGKIGIAEIIGDESKYKIITDSKAQNIFLLPKIPANQTLELAVVNFSGNVADLLLSVTDVEGQVIRISMDSFYKFYKNSFNRPNSISASNRITANLLSNIHKNLSGLSALSINTIYSGNSFYSSNDPYSPITTDQQEIAKVMLSMIKDKEGKYYVTRVKRKIDRLLSIGLTVEQDRIYRFGQLIGARLKVTNNKSDKTLYLKDSDFSGLFDFCLATTVEKTVLLPRSKGFVWIVAREQDDE